MIEQKSTSNSINHLIKICADTFGSSFGTKNGTDFLTDLIYFRSNINLFLSYDLVFQMFFILNKNFMKNKMYNFSDSNGIKEM